jgi:glycosyltransferase involved in cell wall biosynthesis
LDTNAPLRTDSPLAHKDLTVVVPCFNEADSLSYLANALRQLEAAVADRYQLHFVFVDDGSPDNTWLTLQRLFGSVPEAELLRHSKNLGVAAAILTGIQAAKTELVCSIDCDCTYDPMELDRMMLLMTEDVDCVTASPYHPAGRVANVPSWRLALSAIASRLYRLVLGSNLHTFTSCFRVYRRSRVLQLTIREPGFVGIAEILGSLHLQGGRIVEYPATLNVRVLGHSKMKLVRNTILHLKLLCRLACWQLSKYGRNMFYRIGKMGVFKGRHLGWLLARLKQSSDR